MISTFEPSDPKPYIFDWRGDPHPTLEPPTREIEVVEEALRRLREIGLIPEIDYDHDAFARHRETVRSLFDIPWTGISPRMERLIYGINATYRPRVMVAVGIFCGNTFICNAGAAVGPGKCYDAAALVGIEIREAEATRAMRNVAKVDSDKLAQIIAADGVRWLKQYEGKIDLLYIDADGAYLPTIEAAAAGALKPGSLVLAHNSVNMASEIGDYLQYVRSPQVSRHSINMCVDDAGLEVSLYRGDL